MKELKNNIYTETGWEIVEQEFDPEQLVTTGSNFMIGNGYLGYRGTFSEWEADNYVACIVTDTWDTAEDSEWRELCNVPNALFTQLTLEGEPLSAFTGEMSDYRRSLDLRHGLYRRTQTWRSAPDGKSIRLDVEKFASYANIHLIAMRYTFTPTEDAEITVVTGIDGRVWSLNGEHFRSYEPFTEGDLIGMETVTVEFGIQIDVVEGIKVQGPQPTVTEITQEERRILRHQTFRLRAGEEVTLEKFVLIYSSNDVSHPRTQAVEDARAALETGYASLKEVHQEKWDAIWEESDIEIEGDLEAQTLTRFNLYQATIATPTHAHLPIGARGLSCQVYQGAAFWDQETFNLPMYLYTRPELARNILHYRYETLDGAREKARDLGYYGAFYAWTSGKTGEELFPDYFFTNVLTGRKIHNHFNSWQIHISPDIVYALWLYYEATGDWEFIVDYGAEIVFEVAQFLRSHVYFKVDKDRYEFIRLLGPDEYHENVDNNVYTNYIARFALQKALTIYEKMASENPEALEALEEHLGLDESAPEAWQDIVDKIYLPQPDPESDLIEQFDGFFDLEDTTPEELRKRLIDPEEYWGWPNGIAVEAQVLKQADVLQLFALLDDAFPVQVMRANYDYYEPRTEHGSSLSPSVHSVVASKVGYEDEAYRYFMEGSTIDLYNASKKVMSGGSFLGGIHTAAAGAIWQMIVKGFAGFEVLGDGIRFKPALPQSWEALRFKLTFHDNDLQVEITPQQLTVKSAAASEDAIPVAVGEQRSLLRPGEKVSFPA